MAAVSSLYRYPIKGFTPEPRTELVVQAALRTDPAERGQEEGL